MDEIIHQVRSEISSAWRFRWWGMLALWLVCVVGALVVASLPNQYAASAKIFVDASSRLDDVIGGVAFGWDMQDQVERVRQELLSRRVLEQVARDSDLDLRSDSPQAFAALIDSLRERIEFEETRRRSADPRAVLDTVLTISFSDRNRETALAVVRTLLETFVGDVVRGGQGEAETARGVVSTQIMSLRERLKATEDAIAEFKSQNVGLLPGSEGDYFSRLQSAKEQLRDLEAERRSAQQRRDTLRAQLASGQPLLPAGSITTASQGSAASEGDTQTRINRTEAQVSDLLLRFTDVHPEVVQLKQQLERLRKQREEELAALAAASGSEFEGAAYATNPVYQQIQSALNAANVEIAEFDSQIAERQQRVNELNDQINVIPRKEAELQGLEREYGELKEIHDELVRRLERERLGTAAVNDDVNFSVLEEPFVGFNPTAPNRTLLNAGVLVLGFGTGGALAYLLALLNPVFSSSRSLRTYTEVPVLGSVAVSRTAAQQRARKLQILGFATSGVVLVGMFVALVAFSGEVARFVQALL